MGLDTGLRIIVLALVLVGLLASVAAADSIVYEKDGNVWQAAPDGSRQTQVTTAGGFSKPTQSDDGTIVAVKDKLLQRMDRGGRILNTAGSSAFTGPLTPQFSPSGQLVAYNYLNTGPSSPGFHTTLSYSTRQTTHDEIFEISGRGNPSWIGNERVLMFDASESFTGDTLIYTLGAGPTQPWYEEPEMSLTGGEVNAAATKLAATDGVKIRIYKLNAPPPSMLVEERCDIEGPTGAFFRPTWSPDGNSLAWEEGDGIWVGTFDIDSPTCAGSARLVIPGGKAPDWGPADVFTPPAPLGSSQVPATDRRAPRVGLRTPKRLSRAALLRGFNVKGSCDEPCRLVVELLIDRRTAKLNQLAAATVRIGRAAKRLPKAGAATIRLRPKAKARRALAAGPLQSVSVRVRGEDAAGNRSKPVTKKVVVHD